MPRRLVENLAGRTLETRTSRDVAHDDEAAVGRPVRLLHAFRHLARRAARQRGARQRSAADAWMGGLAIERDRELPGARDAEEARARQIERRGLGALGELSIDAERSPVPGGGVEDRSPVRCEAPLAHPAELVGQLLPAWGLAHRRAAPREEDTEEDEERGSRRGEKRGPAAPARASVRRRRRCVDLGIHLRELDARVADRLQAAPRILSKAAQEESPQRGRYRARQSLPVGLVAQRGGENLGRRVALERAAPGEHLEEQAAERPDVGAGVDRLAADLLGAHVGRGAHHAPVGGQLRGVSVLRAARRVRRLGEAEIDELHAAAGRDHHVRGLQVAVDHALGVRLGEAFGDLNGERHGIARRKRPLLQALAERLAVDPLEDQIGRAVEPFEAVDRGDVRVVEAGEEPRLALEALQAGGVVAERVGERLDRHLAPERRIDGAVDAPHAAGAEEAEDLVPAQAMAGGERRGRRLLRLAR